MFKAGVLGDNLKSTFRLYAAALGGVLAILMGYLARRHELPSPAGVSVIAGIVAAVQYVAAYREHRLLHSRREAIDAAKPLLNAEVVKAPGRAESGAGATSTPEAIPAANTPRPRILVVETDAVIQAITVAALSRANFEVHPVATKAAAVEALRIYRYAAILLDLDLPNAEAGGLIREIKSNPEIARVPLVVISSGTPAKTDEVLPEGVAFLQSPLDPQDLMNVFNQIAVN